jgi:hypothetical protein
MATLEVLEQRLAAVERAVAELRAQKLATGPSGDWLERFNGAFKDEPAFDEVIALGREFRAEEGP